MEWDDFRGFAVRHEIDDSTFPWLLALRAVRAPDAGVTDIATDVENKSIAVTCAESVSAEEMLEALKKWARGVRQGGRARRGDAALSRPPQRQ